MVRSAKTRTEKTAETAGLASEAGIADAEVIAETPPEAVVVDAAEGVVEASPARDAGGAAYQAPREPATLALGAPEPARVAEVRTEPAPAPVTVKRVGFLPVALGGVVAAGLGFAAGWQGWLPARGASEAEAVLSGQAERIDEVAAAVAALPQVPDIAPLREEIAPLRGDLASLADRLGALEARMEMLERAPSGDGTLSATAIAGWQRDIEDLKAALAAQTEQAAALSAAAAARDAELTALQDAMSAQKAEMARMVDEAAQRLDAAQSAVAGIEEQATATATATLRRAVLANLQTAMDGGRPYANLVGELEATGVEVPAGLSGPAGDGVATLAALTEAFPEAARAALAAARAEGVADDGGSGLMAFVRRQLDVRSVEPREGDGPDAVLSRAEAALREDRLTDALAEVAALPEVVRAPMGGWIVAAEARMAAISALQSLVETLPAPDTSN